MPVKGCGNVINLASGVGADVGLAHEVPYGQAHVVRVEVLDEAGAHRGAGTEVAADRLEAQHGRAGFLAANPGFQGGLALLRLAVG